VSADNIVPQPFVDSSLEETIMDVIKVLLKESNIEGSLYRVKYPPDVERNLLYVASPIKRKDRYIITIDGKINLIIDANRLLKGAEFMIPRERWQTDSLLEIPKPIKSVSIEFPEAPQFSKTHKFWERYEEYDWPIKFTVDPTRSFVKFAFREYEQDEFWVSLSEDCFASISSDNLTGFLVVLK